MNNSPSNQKIFEEAFEIYLKNLGKEPKERIVEAISEKIHDPKIAALFFDEIEQLRPDAYQIMLLHVFGKIDIKTAQDQLLEKYPHLSTRSLEMATGLGIFLVH